MIDAHLIVLAASNGILLSLLGLAVSQLHHIRDRLDQAAADHRACIKELEAVSSKLIVIETWMEIRTRQGNG